ncbi:hypothetical protein E2562_005554 [Oryza meyeriana var. granulata]|uniref:Uncharacterized protein n=1 Tax=Oryza meyeriana var. granulata TaxID=110450 RepID=A0A6G1F420_9ORYZ|nr:hypothetical protein E2562_005554 [Oryza meyeriana var. granulata]
MTCSWWRQTRSVGPEINPSDPICQIYDGRAKFLFRSAPNFPFRARGCPTAIQIHGCRNAVKFVSSPEGHFQTVICNAPRFVPTAANHDLHHIQWDTPPRQHPHALTLADRPAMDRSGAPFARKFARDDPVLDAIDADLLGGRGVNGTGDMFVRGGWCVGAGGGCDEVGDDWVLRLRTRAARIEKLMDRIVRSEAFANIQCN